jgi:hypothetical protein
MITVADVQNEVPSLISRWGLGDDVGSAMVVDDIGGINLLTIGTPVLSLPSLIKDDVIGTSALGSVGNYFSSVDVAPYALSHGLTIEGLSTADPNGNAFNLFSAPGQAQLQLSGFNVIFNVWIETSNYQTFTLHTLTAAGVLTGWPQHIIGTYDLVSGLQSIYVDNQLVASQGLSGAPGISIALRGVVCAISGASNNITLLSGYGGSSATTAGMQFGAPVSDPIPPGANVIRSGTFITSIVSPTVLALSTRPTATGSDQIMIGMPVQIASPLTAAVTLAAAQDVAIYGAPLSAARIKQHFQAFRQILSDPGHVRVYPQIGVYS